MAVGGGKKLQFGLGIRAVAASQSMSSVSGQRVWAKAGPGLIPWLCPMKGPTRVCVNPRAVTRSSKAKGCWRRSLIPGGGPEEEEEACRRALWDTPVGKGLGGTAGHGQPSQAGWALLEAASDRPSGRVSLRRRHWCRV